jgi:ribose transport system ATP-binding protein
VSAAPGRDAALISIRGLVKDYGPNRVLDGVDFDLHEGEVHALLGENGAGKSTLIKIVAGVETRTDGTIEVCGRALSSHPSPVEVEEAGVAFVHQELGLVDTSTVADNIALPHHFESRWGLVSASRTEERAKRLLEELDVDIDPRAAVGELAQDQKVMVAVARAFGLNARAIVLDEVSASLPTPEFDRFADALRRSTKAGIGYLYVTHRLDEVFDLGTRVTVLRDGDVVGSAPVAEVKHDEVVEWIVGAPIPLRDARPSARPSPSGGGGLRVRGLRGENLAEPLDLEIAPGEILGVCGLVGSGVRAIARLLGGAATPTAGEAMLAGVSLPLGDPVALAAADCAYLAGDRDAESVIGDLSIRENLFIAREPDGGDGPGFMRWPRHERSLALATAERFEVKPRGDVERPVATLSGGNRQKLAIARAVRRRPSLLVVEDPTQGVDVGSRAELHQVLADAAAEGMSILIASSDFEEIAEVADRVLVICQGRLAAEMAREEVSTERLAQASYRDLVTAAEASR